MEMLGLILDWARIDAGVSHLAAAAFAIDVTAGAIIFNRLSIDQRLKKIRDLQKALRKDDQVKALSKLLKQFEKHATPRNLIAHATCAGVLKSDPNSLVFMPYEVHGGYGNLGLEIVHRQSIRQASRFAVHMTRVIGQMMDEVGFFESSDTEGNDTEAEVDGTAK